MRIVCGSLSEVMFCVVMLLLKRLLGLLHCNAAIIVIVLSSWMFRGQIVCLILKMIWWPVLVFGCIFFLVECG